MKRIAAIGLCLAAAALAPSAIAQSLANRPALDFSTNEAFARSVAARYGAATPSTAVLADARAQGFTCAADASYCTRSVMDGSCADSWTIDINPDQSVSGRYARLCMGAEEEE